MAGGAMTLADLKDLVRSLTYEESADTGLFSDTRLGVFIQAAHRRLWNTIARVAPMQLTVKSSDVSLTSSGYDFSGTTLNAQGVHKIVKVEEKDSSGNYTFIEPCEPTEILHSEGPVSTVRGTDEVGFNWYVLGETLYLHPVPQQTKTLRLTYIPNPTDVSDAAVLTTTVNAGADNDGTGTLTAAGTLTSSWDAGVGEFMLLITASSPTATGKWFWDHGYNDSALFGTSGADLLAGVLGGSTGTTIAFSHAANASAGVWVADDVYWFDIATTNQPFGGRFKSWHHLVGWMAADMALAKDEKSNLTGSVQKMTREFEEYLRQQHLSGPRRVRVFPISED